MIYWLIDYPGVGKDYCAEKLSQLLSCPYLDADDFLTSHDKQALIDETFTAQDRLNKLARICNEIKLLLHENTDIAIADSLPDEASRMFVHDYFNGNVRFVLVLTPSALHRQRLKERTNHFFTEDLVDSYIKKNWEPLNLPHKILHNNRDEQGLNDQLRQLITEG
jgi:gluconate kinase